MPESEVSYSGEPNQKFSVISSGGKSFRAHALESLEN